MQISQEIIKKLESVVTQYEGENGIINLETMSYDDCECTGSCGHSCSGSCEGGCSNTCYTTTR